MRGPFHEVLIDVAPTEDESKKNDANAQAVGTQITASQDTVETLFVTGLAVQTATDWADTLNDANGDITHPAGFSLDALHAWAVGRPLVAMASVVAATGDPVSGVWSTSESGGKAWSFIAAFRRAGPSFWSRDGATTTQNAAGLDGKPNTATTIDFTEDGGKVMGVLEAIASQSCAVRIFATLEEGQGPIRLSADAGVTWEDITDALVNGPASIYNGFKEALADATTENVQIQISGMATDKIIVACGERYKGLTKAAIAGMPPVVTLEDPVEVYQRGPLPQAGGWIGYDPQTDRADLPQLSRQHLFRDGPGTTEMADALDDNHGTYYGVDDDDWSEQ